MQYSKNHKEAILKKMMPPSNKTIPKISQEEGILSIDYLHLEEQSQEGSSSPAGWNSKDKFLAVLETSSLPEIEISKYCRKKGIYPEQIQDWKSACEKANDWEKHSSKQLQKSIKQEQKKIKYLTSELTRKEKALAEMAALLVLRKKAQAIWGKEEEE